MSIFKITNDSIENFSIKTTPRKLYSSSSINGVTGSIQVFSRNSQIEKETQPISSFVESVFNDQDLNSQLQLLSNIGTDFRNLNSTNLPADYFNRQLESYMSDVNAQQLSVKKQKKIDIIRFVPGPSYNSNTHRKLVIKNVINKYYRTVYPSAHWAYTNYNCLNFFTASSIPTSSVLLYPDPGGSDVTEHEGYMSGNYALSGAFSFDFHINPRYNQDAPDNVFHDGTIFHLSSSYSLSLVSGSSKNHNGKTVGFKLKLQLSHSADIPPSMALPSVVNSYGIPSDLVFESDDNALQHNSWHHVVVRWGTNQLNAGTGTFVVDGVEKGQFNIPSGTVALRTASFEPNVLAIGNYYEGFYDMADFFAVRPSSRDGLLQLSTHPTNEEPNFTPGTDPNVFHKFRHPLNAEVHNLSIKRKYMTNEDIVASSSIGIKKIDIKNEAFHLPVFFVEESPFRKFVDNTGGIMQSPFFEVDGTTNDPFNVAMSFGVAGHYINTENFVRDFAGNVFPRLHHLTGVALTQTTLAKPANEFLYDQPFVKKRNLSILPCDDGLFVPSYELLASESHTDKYTDDLNVEELSFITLDNLVSTASLLFGTEYSNLQQSLNEENEFIDLNIGFTPEQPGISPGPAFNNYINNVNSSIASGNFDPGIQTGAPLTIFNRTKDPSSNQVTFFDVSNIFYGKRISPGSLEITDPNLSGSESKINITLKDDGYGNLYRANTFTSQSSWNSVGNVYYDEGIILIKSPHLYFFGENEYNVSFRGEQNVHILKFNTLAPANMLNSSSNPTYIPLKPSIDQIDEKSEFVYISGINFHDEDMNVVFKTQLAQPIMKRVGDKIMFSVKLDM